MSTVKNETYLEESFADLLDDCEELQYLCASSYSRIVDAQNQFRKKQKQLSPLEFTETTKQLGVLRESILTLQKKVVSLREKVLRGNSLPQLLQLTSEQDALSTLYRLQLVNVASRIVATDWQSPSFEHSRYSF